MELELKLARIEAENRELKSRLDALEARDGRKVIPTPRLTEPAVTISNPTPVSGFIMPTDDELDRLSTVVIATYPQFGDVSGQDFYGSKGEREEDWWRQYKKAFLALGAFKRLDQPDHKKYLSYHTSAVESYLRAIGKSETLRVGPFMCAVLGHGDIAHSGIGLHHAGHSIEIGISQYSGRDAGDAWRNVLRNKQLLAPSAVPNYGTWSPSRVVEGVAR